MKNKKGFTLIELMVVIVIIGILAAIAIPKLFGMTAKAKAQEVPGAAGTWAKLQAAYLVEKTELGATTTIGYKHPGASDNAISVSAPNFAYNAPVPGTGTTAQATWQATPHKNLNDCKGGVVGWTATFYAASDLGSGGAAAGCDILTPQFVNLR